MDIKSYKDAKRTIEILKESYGANGKAITISDRAKHYDRAIERTRDGRTIIDALENACEGNHLINKIADIARITEKTCGDGTTSSTIAFLVAYIGSLGVPREENDAIDIINNAQKFIESNLIDYTNKENIRAFVRTSALKSIDEKSCDMLTDTLHSIVTENSTVTMNYDDVSETSEDKILVHDISAGVSLRYDAPYPLADELGILPIDHWFLALKAGKITMSDVNYAKDVLTSAVNGHNLSSSTKILILGAGIGIDVRDACKEGRLPNGVIPISSLNYDIANEKNIIRGMYPLFGIRHDITTALHIQVLTNEFIHAISYNGYASVEQIVNSPAFLDNCEMPIDKDILSKGFDEIFNDEHAIAMRNHIGLCEECAGTKNICMHAKQMKEFAFIQAKSVECVNNALGCTWKSAVQVGRVQFKNNTISISGFNHMIDHDRLNDRIARCNEILRSTEKVKSQDWNNARKIKSILSMRPMKKIMLSANITQQERTEMQGAIHDVCTAFELIHQAVEDGEKAGFVAGGHALLLSMIVGKVLSTSPLGKHMSTILNNLAEISTVSHENIHKFSPLDSSLSFMNIVKSAIAGVEYAHTTSDFVLDVRSNDILGGI